MPGTQVFRLEKRLSVGGGLGKHIDGLTRPDTAATREGLPAVELLDEHGKVITRDDAERRRREAAEHLDGCRKVKSRGLQAAPGGDSVRDFACYSAYSEADKIRAVLAGNMATRMPAPTINKLQARLAGLEAQIGWR